jgi:excinuclease UvrABC ATPase subunit
LKEDIIKILSETAKFGVYIDEIAKENHMGSDLVKWFTDKMYCPDCNVTYPEFTPQHFSPNRQE